MEFPELGENCHEPTCKQLDFLPMKCDACSNIFCRDHIHYSTHNCPESYKKDNQVPVCPLCNKPVPIKKDEMPDVVVGQHIDRDCQSDPARKRRKLVPVLCDKCHLNFCLKHRHELDHDCKGFQDTGKGMSRAGAAAIFRNQTNPSSNKTSASSRDNKPKSKPQTTSMSQLGRELDSERRQRQMTIDQSFQRQSQPTSQSVQGGLTEDEALAQAIQLSMSETAQPPNPSKPLTRQEEEDLLLAQAIAASQEESRREQQRRQEMMKITA